MPKPYVLKAARVPSVGNLNSLKVLGSCYADVIDVLDDVARIENGTGGI